MNFLVMPKGIQVKEGLGTGGTYHPHSQMVTMHMCAYGSLGG